MANFIRSNPFPLLSLPLFIAILCNPHRLPQPLHLPSAVSLQQRLVQRYSDLGIQDRELATLSALTLGYRKDLDKDTRRAFSAAGAMHVLAVSGLHTGILASVLLALTSCFGLRKPLYEERTKRICQSLLVMLLLWAYAFLTGCSPSVIRSVIMACLFLGARLIDRRATSLNIVFASAFIMLALVPTDLFSVSFQLSYAAVIAIVLFMPGWKNIMPKVLDIVGLSIAAQIGTLPIALHYFGQISNYFLLTNIIVIPLAWLMMVLSVFTLTVGWWFPLGKGLAWLLNGVTWLMNESVAFIEAMPWSDTHVSLPQYGWMILMIGAGVGLIIWNIITKKHLTWRHSS